MDKHLRQSGNSNTLEGKAPLYSPLPPTLCDLGTQTCWVTEKGGPITETHLVK